MFPHVLASSLVALFLFGFSLEAVAGAPGGALAQCREGLFQSEPNVIGADEACKQAVIDDPADQEARLFRAYTRLARLAEQGSGPLQSTLDDFAFSSSDRHIWHFSPAAPRSTDPAIIGRGDGSIDGEGPFSDEDFFRIAHLEAGDYLLYVAPLFTTIQAAIEGTAFPYSNAWTLVPQGKDAWRLDEFDHGDYRVTLDGDVTPSIIEGTLEETGSGLSVDAWTVTVHSAGEVSIDVLSWEARLFSSLLQYPLVWEPVDVNGDGEIAFFSSQVYLVRNDPFNAGQLVLGASSAGNAPIQLPPDSPTGGDLQQTLEQDVLPAVEASLADLALIDESIESSLAPNPLPLIDVSQRFDYYSYPPAPLPTLVELDYGDVKLFEALLYVLKAQIHLLAALDLDIDIDALTPLAPALRIQQELIDANKNLLLLASGAGEALTSANAANQAAITAYLAASAFMTSEEDDQSDDFASISRDDRPIEKEIRTQLQVLRRSFDGPASLLCNRTLWSHERIPRLNRFLGTSFGPAGLTTHAGAFFGPGAAPPRGFLPPVAYDESHGEPRGRPYGLLKNRVTRASWPDSTFNGVLLPLSPTYDCDADGVADDGDLSGTVGDASCTGGESESCDDNAPLVANGIAAGTCCAGADAHGRSCVVNADCGAGGVCSTGQADQDSDGIGDVVDNCPFDANPQQEDSETRFVVDDADSRYVLVILDGIEPGVDIAGVGARYLAGQGVEFSCGSCATATFLDAVTSLSDYGPPLCGRTMFEIAESEQPLCLRNVVTGQTYELDLLSWGDGPGGCADADDGASCAASGGQTSYRRSAGDGIGDLCDPSPGQIDPGPVLCLVPEPTSSLLAAAALVALCGLRARSAARIHTESA